MYNMYDMYNMYNMYNMHNMYYMYNIYYMYHMYNMYNMYNMYYIYIIHMHICIYVYMYICISAYMHICITRYPFRCLNHWPRQTHVMSRLFNPQLAKWMEDRGETWNSFQAAKSPRGTWRPGGGRWLNPHEYMDELGISNRLVDYTMGMQHDATCSMPGVHP